MGYRVSEHIEIQFQGMNLNCGRYCMEAVMRWKHGTQFGKKVTLGPENHHGAWIAVYGSARTAHTKGVQSHIDGWFKINFDVEIHGPEYGLCRVQKPPSAAEWENHLRTYGPMIVAGHIGAVRVLPIQAAGHYVVVVGVKDKDPDKADDEDQIEYLDPLRVEHSFGSEPTSMPVSQFNELAYNKVFVAATG